MLKLLRNIILLVVGTLSLIIGIIGIILPLLPGTPFIIVAVFCLTLLIFT